MEMKNMCEEYVPWSQKFAIKRNVDGSMIKIYIGVIMIQVLWKYSNNYAEKTGVSKLSIGFIPLKCRPQQVLKLRNLFMKTTVNPWA